MGSVESILGNEGITGAFILVLLIAVGWLARRDSIRQEQTDARVDQARAAHIADIKSMASESNAVARESTNAIHSLTRVLGVKNDS